MGRLERKGMQGGKGGESLRWTEWALVSGRGGKLVNQVTSALLEERKVADQSYYERIGICEQFGTVEPGFEKRLVVVGKANVTQDYSKVMGLQRGGEGRGGEGGKVERGQARGAR